MITKSKTSSRSSLSLRWALLFIELVKIHNPFQWKPPSNLLKKVEAFTAEYNKQHSRK